MKTPSKEAEASKYFIVITILLLKCKVQHESFQNFILLIFQNWQMIQDSFQRKQEPKQ